MFATGVAIALTVFGIETPKILSFIEIQMILVAIALTVFGIETFHIDCTIALATRLQ